MINIQHDVNDESIILNMSEIKIVMDLCHGQQCKKVNFIRSIANLQCFDVFVHMKGILLDVTITRQKKNVIKDDEKKFVTCF